jgi:hypothetical protein
MAYDLYLGKMLMPITPSKISMAINNQNKTINLINDGELNLLKSAGLTDVQFTLLIPQVSYPFARYGDGKFVGASTYLDYFEQLKQAKAPFQFILSRCMPTGKALFDTNMTVSLEDYTITEEAKNGFDLQVAISLKQYKHYATKTISVEIPSPTAPIIVNEDRPIIWNPTPSTSSGSSGGGSSGGGSSKKTSGSSQKSYKVQIIGMGVVTVKASSPADAITKAAGNNWKGTIYVDGVGYNGATKQKITSSSSGSSSKSTSSSSASSTVKKAVQTVSKVASGVANTISKVVSSVKNTITNFMKKATSSSSSVKSTVKKSGGTKYAVVSKK